MLAESSLNAFARAVEQAAGPEATYRALEDIAHACVGVKLFTLMTFDRNSGLASRCYSNMPDAYPTSGTKTVDSDRWSMQVLDGRRNFVANDIRAIADVFDDHELIRSLGCESVLNVPIVVGGDVLGTINMLHEAGFYTPERELAAEILKLPGSVCFLLEKLNKGGR
jgi:GAF domain-containing protein